MKDNGLMPLSVPPAVLYLCDISHRVKCIDSMLYGIKQGKVPRPHPPVEVPVITIEDNDQDQEQTKTKKPMPQPTKPAKIPWNSLTKEDKEHRQRNSMQQYDCVKMKLLAGYYLKSNKHLPLEEYCQQAHCIY